MTGTTITCTECGETFPKLRTKVWREWWQAHCLTCEPPVVTEPWEQLLMDRRYALEGVGFTIDQIDAILEAIST